MTRLDVHSEFIDIINGSPVIVFILRPENGWPVEYISENIRQFGYSTDDFLSGKLMYKDIIHPCDIDRVCKEITEHSKNDKDYFVLEHGIKTATCENRYIECRTTVQRDEANNIQYYKGIIIDVSQRKLSDTINNCRKQVLEALISDASLDDILTHLVIKTEIAVLGTNSFIMLLDNEKKNIIRSISPNVPDLYKKDIEKISIDHILDACSTTGYTGERVDVEEITNHPCHKDIKDNATQIHLQACCLEPIRNSDGEVFGTFGIYFHKPHKPTKEEIAILRSSADLAAIAINNKRKFEGTVESEQKLKIILNNVNDQIYISELDGKAIAVNQAVVDTLGYSKEEMLATYPRDIIPEKDVRYASKLMKEIEKDGRATYEVEAIRKDGKRIPLEISARFILYDGKKTILSVARDVSERKRAERKRHLDEERLEALVKLNKMAGASLNEITDFAREEAVRLTGSSIGYLAFMNADETTLIMHSWSKNAMNECGIKNRHFVYPVKTTGLWGEAVRQRKPIITNDYSLYDPAKKGYPEKHLKLIRHMNIPIFDGDHIVAVAGVGNKTEEYDESDLRQLTLLMQGMWSLIQRKQTEDALKQYSSDLKIASAELRSINMMRNELIAERLESICEPGSECSILENDAIKAIDEQQAKAINTVLLCSERLKHLVKSLLYLSQEQAGKIEYTFSEAYIDKMILVALMNQILQIDEKKITLEVNIPEGLPPIRSDKEKLTEALIILIENAIKFTPKNGKITISVAEETTHLHLKIDDTGPGIQKDLLPHVFQKFYQMEDSMSRMYQGLESGLYICKTIILEHDGQIWIESEKNKGATFHIKLPKAQNEEETVQTNKKEVRK